MKSRLFWRLFLVLAALHSAVVCGVIWVALQGDATRIWMSGLVGLCILLAGTAWLVSRLLRPIHALTRAARRMAAGNYREPVYVAAHDELGTLSEAFNSMRQEMDSRLTQLRETNQRLSTVLQGITDGVIAINEKREVLFANRAVGELMGFDPAAAQGKLLMECVRSHRLDDLIIKLLAIPGQQVVEIEWGEEDRQVLLVNATSFSGDPAVGIVMVIHNLSQLRRLEAMRRDFVANVSHELKTPLTSIKAYAETLSQGALEDEKNRGYFVSQIEEHANRLNQLISDLLSLARIESREQDLNLMQVPLERVVQLCVREQQRAASERNISLTVETRDNASVVADEDGLRQVLINLIDNAIKYTHVGGAVAIGWQDDGQSVAISVRDNGIGIPKQMQDRVFERFFRVDKARSRDMGGTGLGLAIVKHYCQRFGGSIEVESEPGKGSCFTVRLPRYHLASQIS